MLQSFSQSFSANHRVIAARAGAAATFLQWVQCGTHSQLRSITQSPVLIHSIGALSVRRASLLRFRSRSRFCYALTRDTCNSSSSMNLSSFNLDSARANSFSPQAWAYLLCLSVSLYLLHCTPPLISIAFCTVSSHFQTLVCDSFPRHLALMVYAV